VPFSVGSGRADCSAMTGLSDALAAYRIDTAGGAKRLAEALVIDLAEADSSSIMTEWRKWRVISG